jgi:hypothetical protein
MVQCKVFFCTQEKNRWKNFKLSFFDVFFKKIKKDKKGEQKLLITDSFEHFFFFLKIFLKIVVFPKKYQISFIFIQKLNEKATKAKKYSIPACFLKKTPKITQCIIFAPILFRCKRTLLYTTQYFFQNTKQCFSKTPIFISHSVLRRFNF